MRRLVVGAATLAAVAFLVLPSLARLVFLVGGAASADATDAAFRAHPTTGALHVVPGLVMVALLPVQLSARVRARRPGLHRWGGRLFGLAALSVCATAVTMNVLFPTVGGALARSVLYTMAAAQLVTLALGLRAIRQRAVASHRRWMLRATGVALSGASAGVFVLPMLAAGLSPDRVVGVARWLGFVATMGAVELWLRAVRSDAQRRSPAPPTRSDGGQTRPALAPPRPPRSPPPPEPTPPPR